MTIIGSKDTFAIEYEMTDSDYGWMEIWVNNRTVCSYLWRDKKFHFWGHVKLLVEWFSDSIEAILNETEFPLAVNATSSIDFESKCRRLPSDDWADARWNWYISHTWYYLHEDSPLPLVYFRRVENKIEIEWDESDLYDGPVFDNPKGLEFVDVQTFSEVIHKFIESF